jgi:hypothetical protein
LKEIENDDLDKINEIVSKELEKEKNNPRRGRGNFFFRRNDTVVRKRANPKTQDPKDNKKKKSPTKATVNETKDEGNTKKEQDQEQTLEADEEADIMKAIQASQMDMDDDWELQLAIQQSLNS